MIRIVPARLKPLDFAGPFRIDGYPSTGCGGDDASETLSPLAVADRAVGVAGRPRRAGADALRYLPRSRKCRRASPLARQSPLGAASDLFAQAAPPAPQPIPGPAGVGFPVGGMDAVVPEGLPINLAAAMQLSGVRPLDIAAAMAQVQQALALQLQAKALWIPTLNGGVDLLSARWCSARHLHGSEFSERVADVLRRRRPQPVRRAH